MKKTAFIISAIAIILSACTTHRNSTVDNSLLVGTWQQPNITLDMKSNGRYHYNECGYSNKQSGKFLDAEYKLTEGIRNAAFGTINTIGQDYIAPNQYIAPTNTLF